MKLRLRACRVRWISIVFVGLLYVQQPGWTQERDPVSLGSHASGFGQPVVLVERDNVQVADPFQMVIAVNVEEGSTVRFPVLPESLGAFNVISSRDFFDVPIEGGRSWTRVVDLETFESGGLQIPAISLVIDETTKTTSPVSVTVESLLDPSIELTEFRGLKDVEEIPVESSLWKWALLGSIVFVAVVAGAWFAFSRHRRLTSHERWANTQLDALTNSLAFQQKDQTIVLPSSADILRGYIQRKFDIAATRQTTDEFLRRIQFDPVLEEDQKDDLRKFLSHVDKIKFAHLVPQEDQLHETVTLVRTFVQRCGDSKPEASPRVFMAEPSQDFGDIVTATSSTPTKSISTQGGDTGDVVAR